jgi:hydrogenase nickel incorporation protein HypB
MKFTVMKKVLEANEHLANDIRELLKEKNVTMINLISSPGSGKTTILQKVIPLLKKRYSVGIIEGDVETDRDARRLQGCDVPMVLINTQGACHLDSESILNALNTMPLDTLDVIFVENVGNMVCPAEFDIGEDAKIALISAPEGDDKPLKYPLLFREAEVIVLNKIDLLPHIPFDKEVFYGDIRQLNGSIPLLEMAAAHDIGVEALVLWLENKISLRAGASLLTS